MARKHVVIIGGGFGGLTAAKTLVNGDVDITIIDKTNHHLFQPLLYQVATAALSPGDIAKSIRAVFTDRSNVKVIMGEVISIDRNRKTVILEDSEIVFDCLIIAIGSSHSYFGHEDWEIYAPGLKTLNDALNIREKILLSLEKAEKLNDEELAKKYLTFVIVGGGPTGVEMAGAIAEIVKKALLKDFRNINAEKTKVYLLEGLTKVLQLYPDELSEHAKKDLEEMGVEVILNKMVTNINDKGVQVGDMFIETTNVIWAAGNKVSPLLKSLNTELDRAGRVIVKKDLSIKDDSNIFIVGDAAAITNENGKLLPGIAPVAIQEGRYAANTILEGKEPEFREPFIYWDKGNMATIGRAKAVAEIRGFKFTGFFAWILWCVIHIFFLISFRNRLRVMAEWAWLYITFRHGIRLITGRYSRETIKN
jgi:NADH dehydrogenase